jgi:hydroxyethylthiazole kinase-like sugar kinase family protein
VQNGLLEKSLRDVKDHIECVKCAANMGKELERTHVSRMNTIPHCLILNIGTIVEHKILEMWLHISHMW